MDRNRGSQAPIKIVSVALAVSTAALAASVWASKPGPEWSGATFNVAESGIVSETTGRQPASVPARLHSFSGGLTRVQETIKMDTLKLACWDADGPVNLDTSARFVRFTGRGCSRSLKVESWQVSNTSNGFSATVFSGREQLTTDYIPLKDGVNEIRFVAVSGEGVRHESVMHVERK